MKTEWIKMSERKPTKDDLPVLAFYNDDRQMKVWGKRDAPPTECIYWMSIDSPPAEPTQREKDCDAAREEWMKQNSHMVSFSVPSAHFQNGWHAALAYERAEVLKTLNACCNRAAVLAFEDWLRNRCAPQ